MSGHGHDHEHDHGHGHGNGEGHPPGWFENPKNINLIFYALVVACLGCLIGGEFIAKHADFEIEGAFPGFYAVFGFLAYCGIITGAVMLRTVLMREEDYYDE